MLPEAFHEACGKRPTDPSEHDANPKDPATNTKSVAVLNYAMRSMLYLRGLWFGGHSEFRSCLYSVLGLWRPPDPALDMMFQPKEDPDRSQVYPDLLVGRGHG